MPRPYTEEDLPRLRDALAEWRREAGLPGCCHPGDLTHRIYEELPRDRSPGELVYVWEDGAGVAGIALCLRFGGTFDLFTRPALRGGDAELAMLDWACRRTRELMDAAGDGDEPVGTDVFECDVTRAGLLTRLGFERFRVWDHVTERDLSEDVEEPVVPPGFVIRPATMDDAARLAEVRNGAFDDHWTAEGFRDRMMSSPGYRPDREILVTTSDGRAAAFAVIRPDGLNRVGNFEPVGTHPEFRRLGLARAAMRYGLRELRRLGMRTATVQYDATNTAAAALYRGLGFERRHRTLGFRTRS